MAEFQPLNLYENYLAGRQQRQDEQSNNLRNQMAQQELTLRTQAAQQQQQQLTAAQKQEAARRIHIAASYALKMDDPKAFINQNFPEIAALANPTEWAAATPEQVKQKLQQAVALYGANAGIAPEVQKGSGPLYKVVDPNTGEVTLANAQDASGQNPYIYKPPTATSKQAPPPRGYRYKQDGSVEPIPGGPNDPNAPNRPTASPKPPTEGDKRARVMYFSMKNAEKQLEAVANSDTSDLGQAILGKINLDVAKSDEYKRYEAAGLRWAANLLYLKSGATATPEEVRSTYLQFLPQPGDGPTVKAQKNEARAQELAAINDTYSFDQATAGTTNAPAPAGKWSITPVP